MKKQKRTIQKVDSKTCPRCDKTAKGRSRIDEVFGFRNMKQAGQIVQRPQAYCRDCRTGHGQDMRKLKDSKKSLRGQDLRLSKFKENLYGKHSQKSKKQATKKVKKNTSKRSKKSKSKKK